MRFKAMRWVISSFIAIVVLLFFVQLFWLNKIFQYEVKVFRTNVMKAVRATYRELDLGGEKENYIQALTEQPDPNSFLFRIDSLPSENVLIKSLYGSLDNYGILSDCKVAVFDHKVDRYLYETRMSTMISGNPHFTPYQLPLYNRDFSFVVLHFPNRVKFILQSLTWWIVSSTIILFFLVVLGITFIYLYRQRSLNAIQNDFIRNVTHEFQTPLTTLTIGLEALGKPSILSDPDKHRRYVSMLQGQTTYLNRHIQNLVRVLKADGGVLELNKEPVSPEEIIHEVLSQIEVLMEEKKASVQLDLKTAGLKIMADKSGLYLVLLNLLSNALKYSSHPVVGISTAVQKNRLIISISDNGIGIEKKYLSNLFSKFYRVPTGDVHDVKGLGLGLYYSRKIIQKHKGGIQVDSAPGKGTIFTIDLPIN